NRGADSGGVNSGKRLIITMVLLLFAFTGLGAGTAFWLGSDSHGKTAPRQNITVETPAPKPVVIIEQKSEQDEPKDLAEKSQVEKDSQTATDRTKQNRENSQFQSQKSVSTAAPRSSKLRPLP